MWSGKVMIILDSKLMGRQKRYYYIKWFVFQNYIVIVNKKIKVELDFCNYATNSDLKGEANIDTSKFAGRVDLTTLKSDLVSNIVQNDVVKESAYDHGTIIQTRITSLVIFATQLACGVYRFHSYALQQKFCSRLCKLDFGP